jgi:cholesterol transport system auxiliary component
MSARTLLACLVLGLFLGSSCVRLSHKIPERTYYSISVTSPSEKAPAGAPVLLVRPISAQAPYAGTEFVYHIRPDQWKTDFYNRFLTPPAGILSAALESWMEGSGLFSHVVGPGTMIERRLELEGTLEALYGDYTTEPPEAIMKVRLLLLGPGGKEKGGRTVLLDRTYTERRPLPDRTRTALVAGWTSATEKIFALAVVDIRASISSGQ